MIAFGAIAVQSAKHDDVAASLPEAMWFDASAHVEKLQEYCVAWKGTRDIYLADMFSASQGLKTAFEKRGYRAQAFDIHTSYKQDILAQSGFYAAVDMIMSFFGSKICSNMQQHGIRSLKIPEYIIPYHTSSYSIIYYHIISYQIALVDISSFTYIYICIHVTSCYMILGYEVLTFCTSMLSRHHIC